MLDPGAGGLKKKSNNSARCAHFGCLVSCPLLSKRILLSELLSYHCCSRKPQLRTAVKRRACSSRERDSMGGHMMEHGPRLVSSSLSELVPFLSL